MSVTLNAKGTSVPYFTIGKSGITMYQGTTDPSTVYTVKDGDYWFDRTTNAIKVWSTTLDDWGTPRLADLYFSNTSITAIPGQNLVLTVDENQSVVIDSDTNGPILTTDNLQDLHINPAVGGGQYLVLVANRWPTADGASGQVLATNGSGILSFRNTTTPNNWNLGATTTPTVNTAILTARPSSPEISSEITLIPNSANTVNVTIQGTSSDFSCICSATVTIICHQASTNTPVIDSVSTTMNEGNVDFDVSCIGVIDSGIPYLRISVTTVDLAATKTLTWSAIVKVNSTGV